MRALKASLMALMLASPAIAQDIDFGDDSGQWANDRECDDRRFVGSAMASIGVTWEHLGRDASDCRTAFEAGNVTLWNFAEAVAATECSAIEFGDDTHPAANDGECDDPRFDGPAAAYLLDATMEGTDATDCRRACDYGLIGLRDY